MTLCRDRWLLFMFREESITANVNHNADRCVELRLPSPQIGALFAAFAPLILQRDQAVVSVDIFPASMHQSIFNIRPIDSLQDCCQPVVLKAKNVQVGDIRSPPPVDSRSNCCQDMLLAPFARRQAAS